MSSLTFQSRAYKRFLTNALSRTYIYIYDGRTLYGRVIKGLRGAASLRHLKKKCYNVRPCVYKKRERRARGRAGVTLRDTKRHAKESWGRFYFTRSPAKLARQLIYIIKKKKKK